MDLTAMRAACEATGQVVDGVASDQLGLPTPCTEWDVRGLLNHLLGTLSLGEALLSDTAPRVAVAPGGLPAVDLIGDDLGKAYRAGVDRLLLAAGGDALQRTHATPLGEMPGAVLGGFTTLDVLVHGWDLAVATGQQPAFDDRLAEQVLAFAYQAVTEQTRAPRIGPPVAVPDDAPVTDRLVAHLGRQPGTMGA
jgi:uncharacterized protein (TIGR03086 family)